MRRAWMLAALGLVAAGCHTDMWVQPRTNPLDESTFFADGQSARPLVAGTVARGFLREDQAFYTGAANGKWLDRLPMQVSMDLLKRGEERFNIFCSPCHGRTGDGQGMIALRGNMLVKPKSYHDSRLREMPVGHFYDVITNGYGSMYSYASRIEPNDRWAIVAYIRALQLSQHATAAEIGPEGLDAINNPKPKEEKHGGNHGGH